MRATLALLALFFVVQLACACNDGPLGMSSGDIRDWQITASSSLPTAWDVDCHEKNARLYSANGKAWCAKHRTDSEWLQIDLGVAAKITGLITQGRAGKREWVSAYMVSFSTDALHWQYVTDKYGAQRVFNANRDDHSIKHNYLDQSLVARFVKVHAVQWHKHPSMRLEIVGCQECKQPLGAPPYGRMRASSTMPVRNKQTCQPSDGFLASSKAWCPRRKPLSGEQWLELDIGQPTLVTGLVTKGKGDGPRNHWVTKYRLSFSNDSVLWTYYKDVNHLEAKDFGGNADKQMERTHYLTQPFMARFVRFYPLEWNEQIGMRAGLFGCPHVDRQCLPGYFRVNDNANCIENLAYQRNVWTNELKAVALGEERRRRKKNLPQPIHRIRSPLHSSSLLLMQHEGSQPSLVVDGSDENTLERCAILDNYNSERPTLVIDLGRVANVAGVVIQTWQGKGQNSNFGYRDYMYGLERFSVYVDKRAVAPESSSSTRAQRSNDTAVSAGDGQIDTIDNDNDDDDDDDRDDDADEPTENEVVIDENGVRRRTAPRVKLDEHNLCNVVTRTNYAIFASYIHLECTRPLAGRYLYVQADGRTNRWNRLFSAVLCELQVYEV